MPYPNEHAARLVQPKRFDRTTIRRKKVTEGIDIIIGVLTGGSGKMVTQAYRFDKEIFTAEQAKKWLEEHKIKYISFEEAVQGMEHKIQALVQITCRRLQAMSRDEILDLIPAEIINKIKQTDPEPLFQAYSLCHEGISTPTILGDTARPISWPRKAIQSIKNIVTKGVKFFLGHNDDNSTEGRKSVGEVVADYQKEIDGVLHHVVIGYFPDKKAVADKDINSQEGTWNFIETASGLVADGIEALTGIALASSKEDRPAFAGARRLGYIQAFNPERENIQAGEAKQGESKMENLETIPLSDFRAVIEKRSIVPSMLFDVEKIKADNKLSGVFVEVENLKKTLTEKDQEISKLKSDAANLNKQVQVGTSKTRLGKLINDREVKLTDKQKQYVESHFNPDTVDPTDEGLNKFIQSEIDKYKADAALFGAQPEIEQAQQKSGKDDDYSKAENNELLKE